MHPTLAKIAVVIEQFRADPETVEIVRIDMNPGDITEIQAGTPSDLPDGAALLFLGVPVYPDANRPPGGSVTTRTTR